MIVSIVQKMPTVQKEPIVQKEQKEKNLQNLYRIPLQMKVVPQKTSKAHRTHRLDSFENHLQTMVYSEHWVQTVYAVVAGQTIVYSEHWVQTVYAVVVHQTIVYVVDPLPTHNNYPVNIVTILVQDLIY
jgi:hypothetical protein